MSRAVLDASSVTGGSPSVGDHSTAAPESVSVPVPASILARQPHPQVEREGVGQRLAQPGLEGGGVLAQGLAVERVGQALRRRTPRARR